MLIPGVNLVVSVACLIASALLFGAWIRSPRIEPSWRRRLGLIGAGTWAASAALFAWLYIHIEVYHSLSAHGLMLFGYLLTGAGFALIAMIFGAFAFGYLRFSVLLISTVTFTQWVRELVASRGARRAVDVSMLLFVALLGVALARRIRRPKHLQPEI